jgi:hypothetical protein
MKMENLDIFLNKMYDDLYGRILQLEKKIDNIIEHGRIQNTFLEEELGYEIEYEFNREEMRMVPRLVKK